jgi:outer membrane protein
MLWIRLVAPLSIGLMLVAISTAASAASDIAFVEVSRLLKEAPQVAAVREALKKEFARRDDELVAQQNQVKRLEEQLTRDGAIMSEAETRRLERDIISRSRKLKNEQEAFRQDLALRQNEEQSKLRKVFAEVVADVAKREKLDLVLESGVVFASDRVNITDKVLQELGRR